MRPREEMEAAAARVLAEGPVPLAELARRIPAERGRRGHVSAEALVRWITRGRRGCYLDGARLAGRSWYSSARALARFAAALAAAEAGAPLIPSPTEREKRAAAALAELDRLGPKGGRA